MGMAICTKRDISIDANARILAQMSRQRRTKHSYIGDAKLEGHDSETKPGLDRRCNGGLLVRGRDQDQCQCVIV